MSVTLFLSQAAIATAAAIVLSSAAFAADYKIINRLKLPDGAFDYATFDPTSGRVYMPLGTFTNVIDVKTSEISEIPGLSEHIALPVPGTNRARLPNPQGTYGITHTT